MRAMLLAAGLGTRMGPLCAARAKPALRLFDLPLILLPLSFLRRAGAARVAINLHHRPESLAAAAGEAARLLGLELLFSREEGRILGTAGGLKRAEELLGGGTGPLLLANSDTVCWGGIEQALAEHRRRRSLATLLLRPAPPGHGYGSVRVDGQGRVLSIARRPAGGGLAGREMIFVGIHLLEPEIFRHIPGGGPLDINSDIYPRLIEAGLPVRGAEAPGEWLDFGTPAHFLGSAMTLLQDRISGSGRFPLPVEPPGRFQGGAGASLPRPEAVTATTPGRGGVSEGNLPEAGSGAAYLGPGVELHPSAHLVSAAIGAGSRVGAECRIAESLVMERADLGRGVHLEGCLVGPEAAVPDGFQASGSLVTGGGTAGGLSALPL